MNSPRYGAVTDGARKLVDFDLAEVYVKISSKSGVTTPSEADVSALHLPVSQNL
jgi:hypothetical protein